MSKDNIQSKLYEYNGIPIYADDSIDKDTLYVVNAQRMYFDRSLVKRPTRMQKLKRYLSHVWYALKGGECE